MLRSFLAPPHHSLRRDFVEWGPGVNLCFHLTLRWKRKPPRLMHMRCECSRHTLTYLSSSSVLTFFLVYPHHIYMCVSYLDVLTLLCSSPLCVQPPPPPSGPSLWLGSASAHASSSTACWSSPAATAGRGGRTYGVFLQKPSITDVCANTAGASHTFAVEHCVCFW